MINKINLKDIRGEYQYSNKDGCGAGDDTEQSLKLIAEKVNELVEIVRGIQEERDEEIIEANK